MATQEDIEMRKAYGPDKSKWPKKKKKEPPKKKKKVSAACSKAGQDLRACRKGQ